MVGPVTRQQILTKMSATIPSEKDYRFLAASIDHSVCVGRHICAEDKRWRPAVFYESQCGGKTEEGSDLCKKCTTRSSKYAVDPKPGRWTGRITKEPYDWAHMVGTEWFKEKKPTFTAAAPAPVSPVPPSLTVSEKPYTGEALFKALLADSEAEKATLKATLKGRVAELEAHVATMEAKLALIHTHSA